MVANYTHQNKAKVLLLFSVQSFYTISNRCSLTFNSIRNAFSLLMDFLWNIRKQGFVALPFVCSNLLWIEFL